MKKIFNDIYEKSYQVYKYFKYPEKLVCSLNNYKEYKYAKFIPDKLHLKCLFKKYMKKDLDLSNPQTFSEKLQWLKLYDRNPAYISMADKEAVKEYISDLIGNEYIIPTIGIYDEVEEIPFETLPNQFVIKCTHDSGSTIVCTDKRKLDIEAVKKRISTSLKRNFFWYSREWVYKEIKAKIIVEELIIGDDGKCPLDYKFFCFNGKMEIFKIDYDRFTNRIANYYNKNLEYLDFGKIYSWPDSSIPLNIPDNFKKMVQLAEKLSEGIPFLRVDLYSVNNKIYFGELTFYPSGGIEPFTGDGDNIMGSLLELPKINRRENG